MRKPWRRRRRLHPDRRKIFGSPPAMGGFFLGGMWGEGWVVGCGLHRAGGSGQGDTGGLAGMIIVYKERRGGPSGLRGWDCTGLARAAT